MATSTESNPPAKDVRGASQNTPPARDTRAASGAAASEARDARAASGAAASTTKDTRGLSGVSELNMEKSILRRGLATPQEIEACKALRTKLAAKDDSRSLLDIMVDAKVLTKGQSIRLLKE